MSKARQASLLALACAVLGACGGKAAAPAPVPADDLGRQSGWTAHPANPVIRAGDLRDKGLWNDPSVIFEDGRYVIYMTTSVEAPFKPPILPFRATSDDGVRWTLDSATPLLRAEGTDFVSIETPSVVTFQGRRHMFFTGVLRQPASAPMAVGHAVSDDGVRWTASPHPVIAATGVASDWNGYLVGEPGALVVGDELFVYFSAVGARPGGQPPQIQTIGLARSIDGERFSLPTQVLAQAPLYAPQKGYAGYSTPAPFILKDRVHLLFDVARHQAGANPEWSQVALHHAVSNDGGLSFAQDDKPIFGRGDFPWASGEILAPAVLVQGDEVKMWFAGHVRREDLAPLIRRGFKGPEFGIGLATRKTSEFP